MNPNENRHALARVVNVAPQSGVRLSEAVAEFLTKAGIPFANPDDEVTELSLRLKVREDKSISVCSNQNDPDVIPYLERAGEYGLAIRKAIAYALDHSIVGCQHKLVLHYLEVCFGLQNRQLVVTEPFDLNSLNIAPRRGECLKDEESILSVFQSRAARTRAA